MESPQGPPAAAQIHKRSQDTKGGRKSSPARSRRSRSSPEQRPGTFSGGIVRIQPSDDPGEAQRSRRPARKTNAAARRMTIDELAQPASLPSMSAHISSARPALNVTVPEMSSRLALGSRDSPMNFRVARIRTADAGTFTRNAQRHPTKFVIAPPMIGPTASAIPRLAPQNAKA